jgi:hypothetical protein
LRTECGKFSFEESRASIFPEHRGKNAPLTLQIFLLSFSPPLSPIESLHNIRQLPGNHYGTGTQFVLPVIGPREIPVMGIPEAARGHDDDESLDRTIVQDQSPNSQNNKQEASKVRVGDDSSLYDTEAASGSEGSRQGDVFDDAKELALHPDSVTEGAELGQQKAEAAALAWSWPALVGIYAW